MFPAVSPACSAGAAEKKGVKQKVPTCQSSLCPVSAMMRGDMVYHLPHAQELDIRVTSPLSDLPTCTGSLYKKSFGCLRFLTAVNTSESLWEVIDSTGFPDSFMGTKGILLMLPLIVFGETEA